MSENSITINGKEYQFGKLRLKHIKEISDLLSNKEKKSTFYDQITQWIPIIAEVISYKHPGFDAKLLEELELQQLSEGWDKIINFSGIKIETKGEQKPVASTGSSSMEESAQLPAGPTVM